MSTSKAEWSGNVLNFTINKTWDGQDPVDKAEIHISLSRGRRNVEVEENSCVEQRKKSTEEKNIHQLTKTNKDDDNDEDEGLVISVDAPFYDEPRVREEVAVGSVDGLWDYEVVELFFLGMDNKYPEIELAPRGHYLVLLLKALASHNDDKEGDDDSSNNGSAGARSSDESLGEKREVLEYQLALNSYTTQLPLHISTGKVKDEEKEEVEGSEKEQKPLCPLPPGPHRWTGRAFIPRNYLPIPITRFNAYAIHKSDPQRVYMALYPTPTNKYEQPNFHRLHYFQPIDIAHLLP